MSIRPFLKTVIALYSEALWLYFGLAIFAKIQWEVSSLPDALTWILACILGYLSQRTVGRWISDVRIRYALSAIILAALGVFSWSEWIPFGRGYSLACLLIIVFLFLRGSFYVEKEPTRAQMLLRFEGNILWYSVFALLLQVNPNLQSVIHVPFLLAILISLSGMVLTLYPEENKEENVQVRIVGKASGFPGVMIGIVGLGGLMTLFALLPPIRSAIVSFLQGIGVGAVQVGKMLFQFLNWLLSLIPISEEGAPLPMDEPKTPLEFKGGGMEGTAEFPVFWVVVGLAAIALVLALWFLARKRPARVKVNRRMTKIHFGRSRSFWTQLWQSILGFFAKLVRAWRKRFPQFYAYRIYWYFHLLQKWGQKKGMGRLPTESPRDYVKKIVEEYPVPTELKESMFQLGDDFAATFYTDGRKVSDRDFSQLMVFLKGKRV
ncbi:hypothetical protein [Ammoniphilus resinae]|uniref:Uncharacterized membrane protein YuzA (DUF378 family) n=1 Tax=Ammoniphilus resinae TaxID=861532 RepID=A0ABS4GV71_9BACL|nr:hypothetical protein [Ammoniphilus resinae]MBP1934157.1 uncharacterized membrane protein YuzA (DUF378 family) [Ammoniphilus resinae]